MTGKWITVNGEFQFQLSDGTIVKDTWVGTKNGYWYYMYPDGNLAHGGLTYVHACRGINEDGSDAGQFASGYFYLQPDNTNGCIGAALSGTIKIEASTVDAVNVVNKGYFNENHDGHWGACTYVNYKPVVNYTQLPKV